MDFCGKTLQKSNTYMALKHNIFMQDVPTYCIPVNEL